MTIEEKHIAVPKNYRLFAVLSSFGTKAQGITLMFKIDDGDWRNRKSGTISYGIKEEY